MTDASPLVIQINDLAVNYGTFRALTIESLEVSGRTFALIGHNGSGKSTFIKTFLELLTPARGSIRSTLGGELLRPERDMAYSPENGAVFADVLVEDYFRLWGRLKCSDAEYFQGGGRALIQKLEIEPLLRKLGRDLSKGERRRVQIAVGFLVAPRVLVLDEPFEGLDLRQAAILISTMKEHLSKTALLISSHRLDVVERLADQVIMLDHGKVLTSGSVEEVGVTLGGHSIVLSFDAISAIQTDTELLQQRFPKAFIYHVGSQIVATGQDVSPENISMLYVAQKRPLPAMSIERASLTDAVNASWGR